MYLRSTHASKAHEFLTSTFAAVWLVLQSYGCSNHDDLNANQGMKKDVARDEVDASTNDVSDDDTDTPQDSAALGTPTKSAPSQPPAQDPPPSAAPAPAPAPRAAKPDPAPKSDPPVSDDSPMDAGPAADASAPASDAGMPTAPPPKPAPAKGTMKLAQGSAEYAQCFVQFAWCSALMSFAPCAVEAEQQGCIPSGVGACVDEAEACTRRNPGGASTCDDEALKCLCAVPGVSTGFDGIKDSLAVSVCP